MSKLDEKNYLKMIGQTGIKHALNKPFSDKNCGALLAELGAIMSLLPNHSIKLLDAGCGTAWTSSFFAKMGHKVTGIDISEDMIKQARINKKVYHLTNLKLKLMDYENMNFKSQFDCVVFIDSLHHCSDERKAIKNAYTALKPGGICILSEPGLFHENSSGAINAKIKYGVTEKNMPPKLTVKLAKKEGFKNIKIFPRASYLNFALYTKNDNLPNFRMIKKFFKYSAIRVLSSIMLITFYKRYDGIVLMQK